ncbi:Gfo/Idh/MocA family protein [Haloprofundus sp. MHR1]|uniref:Gfo/Idh/MocA family protein n=1 Tax=Haloprofundus sp. MHR1 TaxID=2572921 RepID=UPI0010BECBC7|nr:Gfo/Idh/MocA family oxidoreductase [Haloprofundus sp. MHR1]QCJ45925.1 Gfo/Idh/MocA family oxidoreductase [Haloprofundus sp. MHR1]
MSANDSLGIGFVGAGFITDTFHSETLRGIRHAHAAGVMNPTRSKAEAVAEKLEEYECGDATVHESVGDLTEDPDVDALWITSPNFTRLETVEEIVSAVEDDANLDGIAIEKPLARNLTEARRVVELIESIDVAHAYLENQVYMPGVERVKALLWESAEAAGRPYLARSAEEHAGPHSAWFWDGEKQGGGVLNDMMCHSHKVNKHLLESTTGDDLTPLAVTCDLSTLKWAREEYADRLAADFDVDFQSKPTEDYAHATVFYETDDGEVVVAESTNSWCFVGSGLRITIELLGPEYSGNINTLESGVGIFVSSDNEDDAGYVVEKQQATQGEMAVIPDEVTTYGYLDQNRHVVSAFRAGENAREDLHDGLEVVELCMASYLAAERGERVEFADVDLEGYIPAPARGEFDPYPAESTGDRP